MDRCHQANDSCKGAQESRDNHRFGDDSDETHFRPIARYLGAGRTVIDPDDQFPKAFQWQQCLTPGPHWNRSVYGHMYPGDQKSERDPEFRTRPEIWFLKKFLPQPNDRKKICANVSEGIFIWCIFPCSQTEIEGYPNTLGILIFFNLPQVSPQMIFEKFTYDWFLKNFPISDFWKISCDARPGSSQQQSFRFETEACIQEELKLTDTYERQCCIPGEIKNHSSQGTTSAADSKCWNQFQFLHTEVSEARP